jgi:alanine racemase
LGIAAWQQRGLIDMARPTRFHIHLDRLVNNFKTARRLHGGRVLAVIKANAYGHGDLACAEALEPVADGFAVATPEEALHLREAGIKGPIVLLEGVFNAQEMREVVAHRLTPVIHAPWQVEALLRTPFPEPAPVWIKLDTGMHRLGFQPDELRAVHARLRGSAQVGEITVMTHFANADGPVEGVLDEPLRRFREATQGLTVSTSLCNSGAILGHPAAYGDWARPGLMLYGIDPGVPSLAPRGALQPVMRLVSEITVIRTIAPGEAVGYGSLFKAERPTRVGVIPCGYADGYPRSAIQGTPVAVSGVLVPLIGRVSMDMITVDLTDAPHIQPGAPVELWGDQVAVSTVAQNAGTVAYELLCHARRAPIQHHAAVQPS